MSLFRRLRDTLFGRRRESELDDELRFHLEIRTTELQRGLPREEAQRQAERAFGNRTLLREHTRDADMLTWLESVLHDLRFALRTMRKAPVVTLVAIVSLALGIGANTAIFSLMDAVLWKSLPVQRPEELIKLSADGNEFPYPVYRELRDRNQMLDGLAATGGFYTVDMTLSGASLPESVNVELASGNYFTTLGVNALLGRVFTAGDDRIPGGHPLAVLSAGYWTRRFGGDPGILGKTLILNSTPFTVIGVAPPEFFGVSVGAAADLWAPLTMQPQMSLMGEMLSVKEAYWLDLIGRLKPQVSAAQAQAALNALYRQVREEIYTQTGKRPSGSRALQVSSGSQGLDDLRKRFSKPLRVLMAVVALVLLIACANVANLLLARASARQQEIAVRLAIGAGRARLVRALLSESLLLALFAAAGGLVFANWGAKILLTLASGQTAVLVRIEPDAPILTFTLAVSILTALLFGLLPALQATNAGLAPALKYAMRSAGGGRIPVAHALIVLQVAISLTLLVGAGLFIRSLVNLRTLDPGFARDHLLILRIDPAAAGYKRDQNSLLARNLLERMSAMPGARAMTVGACGMFGGCSSSTGIRVSGYAAQPGEKVFSAFASVGPRFFEALGIRSLAGRDFTLRDDATAPRVAIVNEHFARHFFPGEIPLGKRFGLGKMSDPEVEIVGLVRDAKTRDLKQPPEDMFYVPILQQGFGVRALLIRTAGRPEAMASRVREELRAVDPKIPVREVTTMELQVDRTLVQEWLMARLAGFFAGLAMLLACIGLYGVLSYTVTRRTREIGVRMALGAVRSDVLAMVLRESVLLAAAGATLGAGAALALTRYTSSLLWGVSPYDPITIAGAALVLIAVTLVAAYLPARRAARVDPMTALRYE
jgi:predicted permease